MESELIFDSIILSKSSCRIDDPDVKNISSVDGRLRLFLIYFPNKKSDETDIFFNPSSYIFLAMTKLILDPFFNTFFPLVELMRSYLSLTGL